MWTRLKSDLVKEAGRPLVMIKRGTILLGPQETKDTEISCFRRSARAKSWPAPTRGGEVWIIDRVAVPQDVEPELFGRFPASKELVERLVRVLVCAEPDTGIVSPWRLF